MQKLLLPLCCKYRLKGKAANGTPQIDPLESLKSGHLAQNYPITLAT